MKVVFVGNVCNFAYWFAKWGQELGYDTHALIENDNSSPRDYPQWEDPQYDPYHPPRWVHFYSAGSTIRRALGTRDSELCATLRRFDGIQTLSPAAAIAVDRLRLPQMHHTVGSFARTSSFVHGVEGLAAISPRRVPTIARMRGAMARTRRIIVSTAIDHAEVSASSWRSKLCAIPIAYDALAARRHTRTTQSRSSGQPIRVIMPARHEWHLKGQDIVFRGLSMLPERYQRLISVTSFEWGGDLIKSKALVRQLGLYDLVNFAPMLPKVALWKAFSEPSTVVVDQVPNLDFKGGALGGIARDALAVGAAVVTHAQPAVQLRVHATEPPVIHTPRTPEGVRDALQRVISMSPQQWDALGEAGRAWVWEECHYEAVVPRYLQLHERAGASG